METAPPLAPTAESKPFYLVLCDYGPKVGQSFYEADPDKSDRSTVVSWLIDGQYSQPQQVIEIDLDAGTSRDVSGEIAEEVVEQLLQQREDPPADTLPFLQRFTRYELA